MSRKLLIEVTEQEYEKIKSGILKKEIKEPKEIPVMMGVVFKFKVGEKVVFVADYFKDNEEFKGEIVGYIATRVLPGGEIIKESNPVYMIQFSDDRCIGEKHIAFVEEKKVKSIIDETKDQEVLL